MEYLVISICFLLAIIIMIIRIKRFIKMLYRADHEDEYYHTYINNDEIWTVRLKKPPENSISFKEERDDND